MNECQRNPYEMTLVTHSTKYRLSIKRYDELLNVWIFKSNSQQSQAHHIRQIITAIERCRQRDVKRTHYHKVQRIRFNFPSERKAIYKILAAYCME